MYDIDFDDIYKTVNGFEYLKVEYIEKAFKEIINNFEIEKNRQTDKEENKV